MRERRPVAAPVASPVDSRRVFDRRSTPIATHRGIGVGAMTGFGWLDQSDDVDLDAVSPAETMRNAADRETLADRIPDGWTVRSDIVPYGGDTLTDVLVFRHERTRQEIVVVPESNTEPTGPVSFYHHDRNAGRRRELPVRKASLSAGLDYALDRIDRWTSMFDGRDSALPDGRR